MSNKRPPPSQLSSNLVNTPDGSNDAASFNPVSKWQEQVEVLGLTLFDIHREPRKVNADMSDRVRIPLKVLSPEFHCPVCLGYIKNTRIVKECLHRFCGECIQKCLRTGKKECPQCRVHIPSRRSLREDTNFDQLIKSIYGDIEALEKHEEEEIALLNKAKNMNNAYAESRKRGILQQAMQRKKKNSSSQGTQRVTETTNTRTSTTSIIGLQESPLINFVLRRHPQETLVDRLDREYIRTSQEITVENLKIFLGKKLSYQPYSHFQILTMSGGKAVILDDNITMELVRRDICDNPQFDIILHFRIFPRY